MSAATDMASQTALTGASALFVSVVGLEPGVLLWATIGSIIGVTCAKPTGKIYAAFLFVAATLSCGLLGTIAGNEFAPGNVLARNGFTVILGIIFHPGVAGLIALAPDVVQWVVKRFQKVFGGTQ